jgi:hypothetical protein
MTTTPGPAPDTPRPAASANSDAQAAAAAHSQQLTQVRNLAAALAPADITAAAVIKGVVTAVAVNAAPPVISIQVGGDTSTTVAGVRFIDSYSPVVGDTVLLVKQGSEIFALGQMADGSSNPQSGWTAPSLNSGFTSNSADPVLWRLVIDNGTKKVQMRGKIDIASPGSWTMWTMPAEARPLFNLAPILVARDFAGGSNVAQLFVSGSSTGTMVLDGRTVGVNQGVSSGAGTTGSTAPATGEPISGYGTSGGVPLTDFAEGDPHKHKMGHHHDVNSHTHSTPNHTHTAVSAPTFVSFNGVEYFL